MFDSHIRPPVVLRNNKNLEPSRRFEGPTSTENEDNNVYDFCSSFIFFLQSEIDRGEFRLHLEVKLIASIE